MWVHAEHFQVEQKSTYILFLTIIREDMAIFIKWKILNGFCLPKLYLKLYELEFLKHIQVVFYKDNF